MLKTVLDEAVWIRGGYAALVASLAVILPLPRPVALLLALVLLERILRDGATAQKRTRAAGIAPVSLALAFPAAVVGTSFAALLPGMTAASPLKAGMDGQITGIILVGLLSMIAALIQERPERVHRGETVREIGCNALVVYLALCFLLTGFLLEIAGKRTRVLVPDAGKETAVIEPAARTKPDSGIRNAIVPPAAIPRTAPEKQEPSPDGQAGGAECRREVELFEEAHLRYMKEPLTVIRNGSLQEILVRAGYLDRLPRCPADGVYDLGFSEAKSGGIRITLKCSVHDQR